MDPSDSAASEFARLILRTHFQGSLAVGDRAASIRYVRDGSSGRLIAPVEGWMLSHDCGTLSIEQDRSEPLQLLLELQEISADSDAACDRWLAYHQSSFQRRWCAMTIAGARLGFHVLDPEDIIPINPFREAEARRCKLANSDRPAFRAGCEHLWSRSLPEALCVGMDADGLDVRTRVGMTRLEFSLLPNGINTFKNGVIEDLLLLGRSV